MLIKWIDLALSRRRRREPQIAMVKSQPPANVSIRSLRLRNFGI
jgi:hypothetical protein